jgi:2-succinyl-5-enolpyruvyl-6-hydroxy-3-cyclohexene-1-carboxylate synthase
MGRAQPKTLPLPRSPVLNAFWIIDQLIAQGVDHFAISPGSRSTPLALAVATHPKATSRVHFDERGLGFYGLGYAKGRKKPAALIVTSGTAVANLLPSILEAHLSFTPMIVLTADRPHELRACGANQTIDQVKLFGDAVRFQLDLAPDAAESYIRSSVAQAVFSSLQNPPGPVQLNCSLREPFYPPPPPSFGKPISHYIPRLTPPQEALHSSASRGFILLGKIPCDPKCVLDLAARLKWPVFADLLSGARLLPTSEQIRQFDSPLQPDLILHFGDRLTSKSMLTWKNTVPYTHISPYPALQDPERRITTRIQSDIELFCENFTANTDPNWLASWQKIQTPLPSHPLCVPPDHAVFLGNSMPIRDAENYLFPKECAGFYCNRGVSGIDGNIATAAGLAEGLQKPVIALIGDQACLHDLNSLALLKESRFPVHVIVENNFGGQIFTRHGVAASPHFKKFWVAEHTWNFEGAARMFDLDYRCDEELPKIFKDSSSFTEWLPVGSGVRSGL